MRPEGCIGIALEKRNGREEDPDYREKSLCKGPVAGVSIF